MGLLESSSSLRYLPAEVCEENERSRVVVHSTVWSCLRMGSGVFCCAAGSFFVLFSPVTVIDSLGRPWHWQCAESACACDCEQAKTALRESFSSRQ